MQIPDKGLLAINIVTVLIVKTILIFVLWLTFFSTPLDDKLTSGSVGVWLLGPAINIREDIHGQ